MMYFINICYGGSIDARWSVERGSESGISYLADEKNTAESGE
jgi:hypothetical protein